MSRRSLRLDEGLLDRSLPHNSASFSVGGRDWRSSRSLKSRQSLWHSASCSESLLLRTPHKASVCSLHDSVASDASLISSLLDDSTIQDSTMIDTFWGLDDDVDPKESTIVSEDRSRAGVGPLTGSDRFCTKHLAQNSSRVYCQDCSTVSPSSTRETETTIYCSQRSYTSTKARSGRSGVMSLKEPIPKELLPKGSLCRTAGAAFRWIWRRWRCVTTNPNLRRFPLRLLLVLLPLLLAVSLSWFGPDGFQSAFPAVNMMAWRTGVSDVLAVSAVHSFLSSQNPPAESVVESQIHSCPPGGAAQEVLVADRLDRVEQSLKVLWRRVEAKERRVEARERRVEARERRVEARGRRVEARGRRVEARGRRVEARGRQLVSWCQSGDGGEKSWFSGLAEQPLSQQEDRLRREQIRQQVLMQQRRQTSRLDRLELQLQALTSRTQEVHLMKDTSASVSTATLPAAVGGGVDTLSHRALQEDVSRLETALGDIRRDMDGLSSCQHSCREHEKIQRMISDQVSAQIQDEVRALVYRDRLPSPDRDVSVPESRRFVSVDDLQTALVSLEFRIFQNITLQQRREETETSVTREDVREMLTEALALFSEDRTGLADYALESGGGSILSTRCSETYGTKAALLSLFGVPLWYFSQSPRAVIQPDVHPGNCWAFRGSKGFLVIRLSMRILPTAFTLEHIPKALAPSQTLHSAPRDFSVYGLDDEDDGQERKKLLGTYTYDQDGDALQTFPALEANGDSFQIIEVQVLSNWGHPEYTCMYRFRVHGRPYNI